MSLLLCILSPMGTDISFLSVLTFVFNIFAPVSADSAAVPSSSASSVMGRLYNNPHST